MAGALIAGQPRGGRSARRARRTVASTCGAGLTATTRSTWPSTPTCGARRRWRGASTEALRSAGVGIDDVAHLDLYSLLLVVGALRRRRARASTRGRRRGVDRHRRPAVRRRRGQQLPDPLDRHHGRRAARAIPVRSGWCQGVGMHMTKHNAGRVLDRAGRRRADADAGRRQAGPTPATVAHHRHVDAGRPPWRPTRWSTVATASPSGAWSWSTCPTAAAATAGSTTPTCWPRWRPTSGSGRTVHRPDRPVNRVTG